MFFFNLQELSQKTERLIIS